MRRLMLCLLLTELLSPGCGSQEPEATSPPLPKAVDLFGTPPPHPLAAPEFKATNRDGSLRERSALLGRPTVLWFFPAANTAG